MILVPTCADCLWWRPPPDKAAAELGATRGTCQRYPQAVPRGPGGICGEHPELVKRRDDDLAAALARAVAGKRRG